MSGQNHNMVYGSLRHSLFFRIYDYIPIVFICLKEHVTQFNLYHLVLTHA